MNEPTVELTGHLGADPVLRYTPNGKAVVDLRVATTPRRKVGEEWQDLETLWFRVTCWKQLAENVAASFHKGDRVMVQGRLGIRSYERTDGTPGSDLLVDAFSVGADVARAVVTVKRVAREDSAAAAWVDKFNEEGSDAGSDEGEAPEEAVAALLADVAASVHSPAA